MSVISWPISSTNWWWHLGRLASPGLRYQDRCTTLGQSLVPTIRLGIVKWGLFRDLHQHLEPGKETSIAGPLSIWWWESQPGLPCNETLHNYAWQCWQVWEICCAENSARQDSLVPLLIQQWGLSINEFTSSPNRQKLHECSWHSSRLWDMCIIRICWICWICRIYVFLCSQGHTYAQGRMCRICKIFFSICIFSIFCIFAY